MSCGKKTRYRRSSGSRCSSGSRRRSGSGSRAVRAKSRSRSRAMRSRSGPRRRSSRMRMAVPNNARRNRGVSPPRAAAPAHGARPVQGNVTIGYFERDIRNWVAVNLMGRLGNAVNISYMITNQPACNPVEFNEFVNNTRRRLQLPFVQLQDNGLLRRILDLHERYADDPDRVMDCAHVVVRAQNGNIMVVPMYTFTVRNLLELL